MESFSRLWRAHLFQELLEAQRELPGVSSTNADQVVGGDRGVYAGVLLAEIRDAWGCFAPGSTAGNR